MLQLKHTGIVFCWIVCLLDCSGSSGNDASIEFPETISLSGSEKQTGNIFMRYPFRVRLNDSCIYIMDLHTITYYCHQFDYPSMQHRQSFAKRGEAPGEFLDAENIRLGRNAGCWLLDANKMKMTRFDSSEPDSLTIEVKLDEHLVRTLDFDHYNDSLMIVPDYTGTHRFDLIDHQGKMKESRGSIPTRKRDKRIPDTALAQAWRSFLSYNPENGILAMATQLGEVIEIYDVPGNRLVKVIYGQEGEPRFHYSEGYAIPNGIMGYSDIQVGKTNIYALFWGYTFDDIKRDVVQTEGGNQIRVFDLKGNPIRKYILDRYITGFCINEENGVMIGVDVNSDRPVVEYELRTKNYELRTKR